MIIADDIDGQLKDRLKNLNFSDGEIRVLKKFAQELLDDEEKQHELDLHIHYTAYPHKYYSEDTRNPTGYVQSSSTFNIPPTYTYERVLVPLQIKKLTGIV